MLHKKDIFMIVTVIFITCGMAAGCEEKETVFLEESTLTETESEELPDPLPDTDASKGTEKPKQDREAPLPEAKEPASCLVHVCGAVKVPGVYTLEEDSRVYQAIEMAGGYTQEAGQDYLNLADALTDGMKLYVPTRDELSKAKEAGIVQDTFYQTAEGAAADQEKAGKVNINTASEEALCTLPGIGSGKAKSIIGYRESRGSFQKPEDIMNVEGIKDGLYRKIKDRITV